MYGHIHDEQQVKLRIDILKHRMLQVNFSEFASNTTWRKLLKYTTDRVRLSAECIVFLPKFFTKFGFK